MDWEGACTNQNAAVPQRAPGITGPAGHETTQSPAMGRGSMVTLPAQSWPLPACLPRGWEGSRSGPFAETQLGLRGVRLQAEPATQLQIQGPPNHCPQCQPQVRLSGFRLALSALGCCPTSLSTEWCYLTYIQCQAVSHNLFPSPLTVPQVYLPYEKKFAIQKLPFSLTAKIPLCCLPEKVTNHGTISILNGSVKISAQGTAICKESGMA